MERLNKFVDWYGYTARLLGIPLLLALIVIGAQRTLCTFTCEIANYKCESAFGASDAMAQFMGDLVTANPDVDIVAKPRKK